MPATQSNGLLGDLDWLRGLAMDARAITTVEAIDGLKRKYASAEAGHAPATASVGDLAAEIAEEWILPEGEIPCNPAVGERLERQNKVAREIAEALRARLPFPGPYDVHQALETLRKPQDDSECPANAERKSGYLAALNDLEQLLRDRDLLPSPAAPKLSDNARALLGAWEGTVARAHYCNYDLIGMKVDLSKLDFLDTIGPFEEIIRAATRPLNPASFKPGTADSHSGLARRSRVEELGDYHDGFADGYQLGVHARRPVAAAPADPLAGRLLAGPANSRDAAGWRALTKEASDEIALAHHELDRWNATRADYVGDTSYCLADRIQHLIEDVRDARSGRGALSASHAANLVRLLKVLTLAYSKGGGRLMSVWMDDVVSVEAAITALRIEPEGNHARRDNCRAAPADETSILRDWMREPDFASDFSLEKITDWINRRPISVLERLIERRDEQI